MSSWLPWGRGRRNDDLSELDSSNSSGSTVERKVKFVFGFRSRSTLIEGMESSFVVDHEG